MLLALPPAGLIRASKERKTITNLVKELSVEAKENLTSYMSMSISESPLLATASSLLGFAQTHQLPYGPQLYHLPAFIPYAPRASLRCGLVQLDEFVPHS